MQACVALLGLFAVVAAGPYTRVKHYGAEGCADGDLMYTLTVATSSVPTFFGMQDMEICDSYYYKLSCNAGFVDLYEYTSEACADSAPAYSTRFNCHEVDGRWVTYDCNADTTDYTEFPTSWYSASDCTDDPMQSYVQYFKLGACDPVSNLTSGTWNEQSYRVTRSGEVVTTERFPNLDCSGTAFSVEAYTCGVCEFSDVYFISTCPAEGGATPSPEESSGGAGFFSTIKWYSAEGCAEGDLMHKEMRATSDSGFEFGTCSGKKKWSCTGGYVTEDEYESDMCAGAIVNSTTYNCRWEPSYKSWDTYECNSDGTGYSEFRRSEYYYNSSGRKPYYATNECVGDPMSSDVSYLKVGACDPYADLDSDGRWTERSRRVTRSGEVVTYEEFYSMNCSGTADAYESWTRTCGACEFSDSDYSILHMHCSSVESEFSGTFQLSCMLPALTLLAVGAMSA